MRDRYKDVIPEGMSLYALTTSSVSYICAKTFEQAKEIAKRCDIPETEVIEDSHIKYDPYRSLVFDSDPDTSLYMRNSFYREKWETKIGFVNVGRLEDIDMSLRSSQFYIDIKLHYDEETHGYSLPEYLMGTKHTISLLYQREDDLLVVPTRVYFETKEDYVQMKMALA